MMHMCGSVVRRTRNNMPRDISANSSSPSLVSYSNIFHVFMHLCINKQLKHVRKQPFWKDRKFKTERSRDRPNVVDVPHHAPCTTFASPSSIQFKKYSTMSQFQSTTCWTDHVHIQKRSPRDSSEFSYFAVSLSNQKYGINASIHDRHSKKENLKWVDTLSDGCYHNLSWNQLHSDKTDNSSSTVRTPPFSILSWNILAQSMYEAHFYETPIEQHSSSSSSYFPRPHPWPERCQRILQILSHSDPDIVCLQECELHSFQSDLSPALSKLGYDGIAQEDNRAEKPIPLKDVTKHRDRRNHIVATFWKRDKWEPLDKAYVRTRTLTNILQQKRKTGTGRQVSAPMDPLPIVAVINCHLEGNPRRYSERVHQLQHALTDLAKLVQPPKQDVNSFNYTTSHQDDQYTQTHLAGVEYLNGLLIVGDFNCELQSSVCSTYLRQGHLGLSLGMDGLSAEDAPILPSSLLESTNSDASEESIHPILEWGYALTEEQVPKVVPHPFRSSGMMSAYPPSLGKYDARQHFTYIGRGENKRPAQGVDQIWFSSKTLRRIALKRMFVDFMQEWSNRSNETNDDTDVDSMEKKRAEEREKVLLTGLPDPMCMYPSDHLPIGGIFEWEWDVSWEKEKEFSKVQPLNILIDKVEKEARILQDVSLHSFSSSSSSSDLELFEQDLPNSIEALIEELDYLLLHCPYDSEQQRLDVLFILSPIHPPLPHTTATGRKPTPAQLQQINDRRERKNEMLITSSTCVRPWLKRIWKAKRLMSILKRK